MELLTSYLKGRNIYWNNHKESYLVDMTMIIEESVVKKLYYLSSVPYLAFEMYNHRVTGEKSLK